MSKPQALDYMNWLHELTVSLYDYDIMLRADMDNQMRKFYDSGLSTEAVREKVIRFVQTGSWA